MDAAQKLQLLQQQIDEANAGDPSDLDLWRQQTEVALRNVVGDASPLYMAFQETRYTPIVWTSDTSVSDRLAAQRRGVLKAISTLEAAKMEVELSGGMPAADVAPAPGRDIFIVHGHDDARKHEVARFLRALTGNEPIILHEQPGGGRTVIEKFEQHAASAGYAVVIATPDDVGKATTGESLHPRARQNVIFELGFFYGALGRARVALLYDNSVERPSDISGVVTIELDPSGAWKMLLAREISSAGVGVRWDALGK
jgi:predicted nucleotide-binding protein